MIFPKTGLVGLPRNQQIQSAPFLLPIRTLVFKPMINTYTVAFQGSQTDTYLVGPGCTRILVAAVGSGGDDFTAATANGGGGGGFCAELLSVAEGQSFAMAYGNGNNVSTSFGGILTANGANVKVAGSATGGRYQASGGTGGTVSTSSGGGAAPGSPYGTGGNGGNGGAANQAGGGGGLGVNAVTTTRGANTWQLAQAWFSAFGPFAHALNVPWFTAAGGNTGGGASLPAGVGCHFGSLGAGNTGDSTSRIYESSGGIIIAEFSA